MQRAVDPVNLRADNGRGASSSLRADASTNPQKALVATIRASNPRDQDQNFRYAALSSGLDIVREALGGHEIATVQATAIDNDAGLIRLTTTLALRITIRRSSPQKWPGFTPPRDALCRRSVADYCAAAHRSTASSAYRANRTRAVGAKGASRQRLGGGACYQALVRRKPIHEPFAAEYGDNPRRPDYACQGRRQYITFIRLYLAL